MKTVNGTYLYIYVLAALNPLIGISITLYKYMTGNNEDATTLGMVSFLSLYLYICGLVVCCYQ